MKTNNDSEHYFAGHHVSDHMLALLADSLVMDENGAPPPEVPGDVLDHVDTCNQCKDKIMDVVLFMRNPEATPAQPAKPSTPLKPLKPVTDTFPLTVPQRDRSFFTGKIAAVFVACAVMVGAYFLVFNDPNQVKKLNGNSGIGTQEVSQELGEIQADAVKPAEPVSTKKASRTAAKKNTVQRIGTFDVNPTLENMIGSRLRSGTFEAVTPPDNSEVDGIIHFSWKKKLEKVLTLNIVDNRNRVLYTYRVDGPAIDVEEDLKPGLYYWKVENENELLYVGKFLKR